MDHIMNWLLEEDTPEIRYRTMVELLGMAKDGKEVKDAYDQLLSSKSLSLVMDKFKLNDKWEDVNALLTLAEFGLTRDDVMIDEYVERIIKKLNRSMKCAKILLLRNLVALGYYEHPWVEKEINLALTNIRQDGTVRCLDAGKKRNDSRLPDMGCYRQTTTYLLLGAELKKKGIILLQFDPVVNFYISHDIMFHTDNPEKMIIKEMTGTFFPIDHVHIGLQIIMYGISIFGAGNHMQCKCAWEMLDSKRDVEGKYILTESFQKPYFDVGTVGQANKWVTLYVLLSKMYRSGGK
ncbi:hypothetical protein [Anaerosporobacter faecicola]|uniref:hypothetical protein n=1 Tax=Anaerosporobacter faecicola TaxID=2718714 RepID=UPI00143C29B4|nr:hypothetical protein [Anaerosporobacter faecicola]